MMTSLAFLIAALFIPLILFAPGCTCCGTCGCRTATAETYYATVSGLVNVFCENCSGYEGTFALDRTGECEWRYYFPDPPPCGFGDHYYILTIADSPALPGYVEMKLSLYDGYLYDCIWRGYIADTECAGQDLALIAIGGVGGFCAHGSSTAYVSAA